MSMPKTSSKSELAGNSKNEAEMTALRVKHEATKRIDGAKIDMGAVCHSTIDVRDFDLDSILPAGSLDSVTRGLTFAANRQYTPSLHHLT